MNHFLDFTDYFPGGGIQAGISLKKFPYSPPEDRKKIVSLFELNPEQIVIPVQTHSNNVVICTKSGGISNTDGMITNEFGLDEINNAIDLTRNGKIGKCVICMD